MGREYWYPARSSVRVSRGHRRRRLGAVSASAGARVRPARIAAAITTTIPTAMRMSPIGHDVRERQPLGQRDDVRERGERRRLDDGACSSRCPRRSDPSRPPPTDWRACSRRSRRSPRGSTRPRRRPAACRESRGCAGRPRTPVRSRPRRAAGPRSPTRAVTGSEKSTTCAAKPNSASPAHRKRIVPRPARRPPSSTPTMSPSGTAYRMNIRTRPSAAAPRRPRCRLDGARWRRQHGSRPAGWRRSGARGGTPGRTRSPAGAGGRPARPPRCPRR